MRLWHSDLIPQLDGRRLCDLHMSCCNLRGNGWGKRNIAINYIYDDDCGEEALAAYHHLVLKEMSRRGYKYDPLWKLISYCGKKRPPRDIDPVKYVLACQRGVPLWGHNNEIYENDVKTLRERGLNIVGENHGN